MSIGFAKATRLEFLLAGLLRYGTHLASAVTVLGLTAALIGARSGAHDPASLVGMHIVTAGIAFFILLPVLRVLLMLIVFARERDYRFAAISATVLTIILTGFAVGTYTAKSRPHVPGPSPRTVNIPPAP